MKSIIKIVFVVIFFFSLVVQQSRASGSMRRCMLLPVTDNMQGALSFKVFEEIEAHLKDGNWCIYKSNSEILNILKNYRNNLKEHLNNKEVLKILAEKTSSGTLIKINLDNITDTITLQAEVVGENGEDVYLKESAQIKNTDIDLVGNTIKNWLNEYQKNIPYNGKLVGILGEQFSTDIGKQFGISDNQEIIIVRPIKRKTHPLLKEIVEWETEKIAEGKMFHVAADSSQGKVTDYESKKRLQLDDWIILKQRPNEEVVNSSKDAPESEGQSFGKIGNASIYLDASKDEVVANNGNNAKYSGTNFGIYLKSEIWITREYWLGLDFGRKFGSYTKDSGTGIVDSDAENGVIKIKGGYKYLPMGFFYGPQLDGYIGYANYSYGVNSDSASGLTEVTFKGPILGVKGSIPFMNIMRPFLGLEFMALPEYVEDTVVYGKPDSVSSYFMQIGMNYILNSSTNLDAMVNYTSNKATIKNSNKVYSFSEISLKLGATFSF